MTNSNDRNNLAADQTDDLIAELARIVADDAKQASVSKSVDERAQIAANARSFEQEPPANPEPSTPAIAEEEPAESDVLPFSQREVPAPFSQVGTGVTAVPTEPQTVAEEQVPAAETPFEFDFSNNIKMGVDAGELLPTTTVEVDENIEQAPTIAEETISSADAMDSIAAIIEDAEKHSAAATPSYEATPVVDEVPAEPIAAPQYDEPEPEQVYTEEQTAEQAPGDFQYIPQQGMQIPEGEDEFAIPPSMDDQNSDNAQQADDPLNEIEKLIADTDTPPVRHDPKPADAAEAAILAALASASGDNGADRSPVNAARATNNQRKEPRFEPEAPTARDHVEPIPHQSDHTTHEVAPERETVFVENNNQRRRGGFMPIIASVAAIVLLAVLGGVGYWYFVGNNVEGQDVPVVAAQNTQVREAPEVTPSETEGSSVFDALEGNTEPTSQEQLISRDETDGASGADVARVVTPNSTSGGLTNRKVKTVTVLADGTIVSGTEASAGAEQLPQDVRPNAPTVTDTTSNDDSDQIANVLNAIKEGAETTTEPTIEDVVDTATDVVAAVEDVTTANDPSAPVPPARPTGLGLGTAPSIAVAPTPTINDAVEQPLSLIPANNATPAPTSVNTTTSAGVDAPFYVQLASQRSLETAQTTASSLKRRFASDLGNQSIDIKQVDLGERGIFFRVRVPANSLVEANALCSNLKSNGGDCFVRNN